MVEPDSGENSDDKPNNKDDEVKNKERLEELRKSEQKSGLFSDLANIARMLADVISQIK